MESLQRFQQVTAFKSGTLGHLTRLLDEDVPPTALLIALEDITTVLRHDVLALEEDERTGAAELPLFDGPLSADEDPTTPPSSRDVWLGRINRRIIRMRKGKTPEQAAAVFASFTRKWGPGQVNLLWDALPWRSQDVKDFDQKDRNMLHAAAALWGERTW